jgi:hypothetical protein
MLVESLEWQNTVVRLCIGLMIIIVAIWYMFSEVKDIIEKNKKKNMDGGKNE